MHTLKSMSLLFSQVCCCIHIGYISEHKNPIVSIHFLNEWGDLQVVPYKAQTPDGKIIGPVLQLEIQYSMFCFCFYMGQVFVESQSILLLKIFHGLEFRGKQVLTRKILSVPVDVVLTKQILQKCVDRV